MQSIQTCNETLFHAYKNYGYVSTPLLQHEFGLHYRDAVSVMDYAQKRKWITPEDPNCTSFKRFFIHPVAPTSLSKEQIKEYAGILSKSNIELLLEYADDTDGFLPDKLQETVSPFQRPRFMRTSSTPAENPLVKMGLVLLWGERAYVTITRASAQRLLNAVEEE